MAEHTKLIQIYCAVVLFTVLKKVEASCYYYYDGYDYSRYCYYNPYLVIFGSSYGAVIGLGILVSLVVCFCCIHKKNRQWIQGGVIVPRVQGTNNPLMYPPGNQQIPHPTTAGAQGIQTPYIMMGPMHYGGSQGLHGVQPTVNLQTNSSTGENPSADVQQDSK
ncbi:uncharacterized protein LOC134260494 [Saccostrea cucullata]|uniref:uncharacterized protein LOC134260494 n=1 Tax=Saccostrea cuccullata TaxID=36930 RepID=UPI002ED60FE5